MAVLDIALNWLHVLSVVIFLGGMFLATFGLMPVLKAHVDYEPRHKFILHFIPKARSLMRVVVTVILVTGVARALLLHYTYTGEPDSTRLGVFALKLFFAFVPVLIFALAPKILGKYSDEGLCCDPDKEGPSYNVYGVMTSTGAALHYAAISSGWLAVLCAIILGHMH